MRKSAKMALGIFWSKVSKLDLNQVKCSPYTFPAQIFDQIGFLSPPSGRNPKCEKSFKMALGKFLIKVTKLGFYPVKCASYTSPAQIFDQFRFLSPPSGGNTKLKNVQKRHFAFFGIVGCS